MHPQSINAEIGQSRLLGYQVCLVRRVLWAGVSVWHSHWTFKSRCDFGHVIGCQFTNALTMTCIFRYIFCKLWCIFVLLISIDVEKKTRFAILNFQLNYIFKGTRRKVKQRIAELFTAAKPNVRGEDTCCLFFGHLPIFEFIRFDFLIIHTWWIFKMAAPRCDWK